MTGEEAIKWLKTEASYIEEDVGNGKEILEAYDMAIKTLEQKPCEDCISREALLAKIDEERKHLLDLKMDGAEHIVVHHARRIIEEMPPVTPQSKWIPVSERLPEENGDYLVTFKLLFTYLVEVCYFDGQTWDKGQYDAVLAWMPMPEPYQGKEAET